MSDQVEQGCKCKRYTLGRYDDVTKDEDGSSHSKQVCTLSLAERQVVALERLANSINVIEGFIQTITYRLKDLLRLM